MFRIIERMTGVKLLEKEAEEWLEEERQQRLTGSNSEGSMNRYERKRNTNFKKILEVK